MDNTSHDIDLKQILADMARAIVDDPDSVSVTEEENEEEHANEGQRAMG